MTTDGAVELMRNMMIIIAQVSGPALLSALVVGLFVGVLQTATQVNEASISFVVKLLAVTVALVAAGPYVLAQLIDYTRHTIGSIAEIVR
jgi:flagellar biosynthetic protein FliQ